MKMSDEKWIYINNFHCSYYFWEVSSVFDDRPLFILNTLLKKHNNKIKHWLFENLRVCVLSSEGVSFTSNQLNTDSSAMFASAPAHNNKQARLGTASLSAPS